MRRDIGPAPSPRLVSAKHLRAMKRKQQAVEHQLRAEGKVSPESVLLLRPKRLKGARIEWPDAPLVDEN